MFKRHAGKTKTIYLPKKASTAFAVGDIVAIGTSGDAGLIIPATASTTALANTGVIQRSVASTDADYAQNSLVPIEVPVEKNVEWTGDVTSGLVAADVGLEVDLTDAATINRAASSIDAALVREVISSTKGVFVLKLNGSY